MKKIRVVILDDNKNYLESLSAFMRTSEETNQFIVTCFTEAANLHTYIQQGQQIDILLISTSLLTEDLQVNPGTTIMTLEDDEVKGKDGLNAIYRYQRLNQLISSMLAIYYEHNEVAGRLLSRSKQTRVIASYSTSGGAGKTTVAVNLSKQLALTDAKVFYLNLELFNSTSLYFTSAEDRPSLQIFYYVKAETEQLRSKLEALKKYDPYSMVDYFDLEISADEMLEMSEKDVGKLVNGIVETGTYDYVVVDLDSSLHERNIAVLKEADHVIWTIVNDVQSQLKLKSFFAEEEKLVGKENLVKDKTHVLLNKHIGTPVQHIEAAEMSIDGYLPYIETWSSMQSSSEILGNELFNQELQAIIQDKIIPVREGVVSGNREGN
ncbi:ParA-like protein [Oceanobacillus picturae]|uniref:ParA-like protein n=1 Tax=Oceanobacillus picturae TaxID=171693 RepID=A0A0U9HB12_9BACI|nr:AAA family ATPase [Oceanobacillus picturae]GAQ19895.1 ParA-like protein [Oceanobacillus picturae]